MKKIQFRFLLLISGWLFLGAAVEAQTFTTPPPATASLGAYIPIAGNAPAVLPPPQVSLLIIWTQTPSGTWTNQVVASGVGGTLSGSTTVTLNATGTWHFAIGSVAPPPPGYNAAPSGNYASASTVVATPITAATIASNLTYNGSAQYPNSVSSVTPTGATVSVSATSSYTNAGSYNNGTVTGTGNYTGTLSNLTWTINRASQSVTFNNPGTQSCGTPLNLGATASSGLAVTYSVTSGPAIVNGSVAYFTGTGSVTITASQGGNTNWNAAQSVPQSFQVNGTVVTPVTLQLKVQQPNP